MIQIREREELDSTMLNALSEGGVFYSEGYCQYIKLLGDRPMYLFDDHSLMLIVVKRRGPFRFARLPVEYIQHSQGSQPDGRRFLDACMDYCRDVLKLHWIHHPEPTARFQETPSRCIRIPYSTYLIDTSLSTEDIWSGFKSSVRNKIRKAHTLGVEYKSGGIELLDDFYTIYSQTAQRSGFQAAPRALLQKQFACFGDQIIIAVVHSEGVVHGARLCYYANICYGMFSGSASPSLTGAGNLLYWGLFMDLVALNVKKYSMVGARINAAPDSKHERINRYKSGFSPIVEPCFLFKVVLDPKMYRLYRQVDRMRALLKQEQPAWDIIDQEIGQWMDMNDPESMREVYGQSLPQPGIQLGDEAQNE